MEFEWDDDKFMSNLAKHGVSFGEALLIFEGPLVTRPDDRKDYGEVRFISIGEADGRIYVVVHTMRNDIVRIISARLGGHRDRKDYYAHLAG